MPSLAGLPFTRTLPLTRYNPWPPGFAPLAETAAFRSGKGAQELADFASFHARQFSGKSAAIARSSPLQGEGNMRPPMAWPMARIEGPWRQYSSGPGSAGGFGPSGEQAVSQTVPASSFQCSTLPRAVGVRKGAHAGVSHQNPACNRGHGCGADPGGCAGHWRRRLSRHAFIDAVVNNRCSRCLNSARGLEQFFALRDVEVHPATHVEE